MWRCHDFVITNNKITVGVNYDNEEEAYKFDEVFLSVAGFNKPRDIVQVSRRCRFLNSNNIKVVFIDGFNKKNN